MNSPMDLKATLFDHDKNVLSQGKALLISGLPATFFPNAGSSLEILINKAVIINCHAIGDFKLISPRSCTACSNQIHIHFEAEKIQ